MIADYMSGSVKPILGNAIKHLSFFRDTIGKYDVKGGDTVCGYDQKTLT